MSEIVFPSELESLRRRAHDIRSPFVELIQKFLPLRQELLRRRNDMYRLEFSRMLEIPVETRPIREAEWRISGAPVTDAGEWIDFEADPEVSPHHSLNLFQRAMTSSHRKIRLHSIAHEERSVLFRGRHVPGFLFNLAMIEGNHVLFLPKLETRYEARSLSELLHFWQGRTGRKLSLGLEFETIRGVVEAEEILFELKDFVVAMTFDPVDYLCSVIRKLSGQKEFLINPFREEQRFGLLAPLQAHLRKLAERRGPGWVDHPAAEGLAAEPAETNFYFPKLPAFRRPGEEEVRALIREALHYLIDVLGSAENPDRAPESDRFSRFELARALLWQWIHHDAVSDETYFRLRDLEAQELSDARSETARRLLDSFLLNGNFVEFSSTHFAA